MVGVIEHFGLTGGVFFGVTLGVTFGVAFGDDFGDDFGVHFDGDRVRTSDCVESLVFKLLFDDATDVDGTPNSFNRGGEHPR